jgi:hypothetical protein
MSCSSRNEYFHISRSTSNIIPEGLNTVFPRINVESTSPLCDILVHLAAILFCGIEEFIVKTAHVQCLYLDTSLHNL